VLINYIPRNCHRPRDDDEPLTGVREEDFQLSRGSNHRQHGVSILQSETLSALLNSKMVLIEL
jgi:hypothetical protein